MSGISEAERLYQQMGGNTPEEDLSYLKVYIKGDKERGEEIIDYLCSLDSRVKNTFCFEGNSKECYYYIDINDSFEINHDFLDDLPSNYKQLFIEDILDEIEEENIDNNDEEEKEYCPACDEELTDFNGSMFYTDGDEACESCYDESLEDLDDEEAIECDTQASISSIDKAENLFKQLSETPSAPKDIIDVKLSELSKISKRRR